MSDDAIKKAFSNNLKYYMSMNGIKQIDIMKDLDIPSATISSWVNGVRLPRMEKIQELATYLGITKSDLIENVVIGNFSSKEEAEQFKKDLLKDPKKVFTDERSYLFKNEKAFASYLKSIGYNVDYSESQRTISIVGETTAIGAFGVTLSPEEYKYLMDSSKDYLEYELSKLVKYKLSD